MSILDYVAICVFERLDRVGHGGTDSVRQIMIRAAEYKRHAQECSSTLWRLTPKMRRMEIIWTT